MKKILATIIIATLVLGTVSFAQNEQTEKENKNIETINAEDVGIRTISKEVVEDEIVIHEDENSDLDEAPIYEEEVEDETPNYIEPTETDEEDTLQEEVEPVEDEDLDIPPEGMCEGYEAGVYLPVNSSCELHSECYRCEQCTYERTLSYDEELEMYIGEETCIVCGHGTCVEITEEEVDDYAPVTEEEESEE